MRFFNVTAVLCLFLLTGCNPEFTERDVRNNNSLTERVSSQSLDQFVKVRVQPTAKPEKYMVYFSWPRIEDGKFVRVRLDKTLIVVNPNQTDFNHEVFHDQTLTYTFEILDSASKIEKSFPKQIKIPRDYVVREGQASFAEDTRLTVNRIFITNEIPLTTNGFNVELIANELHSKDGVIETFPENSKAKINLDGRSGGILKVNVQLATGDLKIYMRGENGGDGAKGETYLNRAADGRPAGSGSLICECVGKNCFVPASTLKTNLNSELESITCYCDSRGENGGPGANGSKGRKGLRAGNGGSAGQMKITIQDGREFDLQSYAFKGVAGTPGPGGDGQDGGIGGQLLVNDRQSEKCGGAIGANGTKGPQGDAGDLGKDGDLGLLCTYIASENKNDCYQ